MIEPLLSDDALLADIASVPLDAARLDIWWLGQSGYLLVHNGHRLLAAPYLSDSLTRKYASTEKPHVRMSRRVIDPSRLPEVGIVFSTHAHTDHLDAETLQAIRRNQFESEPLFIAPRATEALATERFGREPDILIDAYESRAWGSTEIRAVPAAHPVIDRNHRGWHSCLGYLIRMGSFTVYHSGDTMLYDSMAKTLVEESRGSIDLAILPINGKVGNMDGVDAARLAKDFGAKLVVPCHYHMFEFNTAEPAEKFIPECERLGQPYKVLQLGERLTLEKP